MTKYKSRIATVAILAILSISGCAANYEARSSYLLEMAQRGVETNKLLRGQGEEVDDQLCRSANRALNDDIPSDQSLGYEPSEDWKNLVEETFVNACISGEY